MKISYKPIFLVLFLCLDWSINAQNVSANDGYYNYLGYEFFAQDRLNIFNSGDPKSRITILPDFDIRPELVKVYDEIGNEIKGSADILHDQHANKKYSFKVVVNVASPIIHHKEKFLILGYVLNMADKKIITRHWIRILVGKRARYLNILGIKKILGWHRTYKYVPRYRELIIDLETQLKDEILEYSFEQVSPRQISGSLSIGGDLKSSLGYNNASLGSQSSIEFVGSGLSSKEAKLLLRGDFNLTLNMILRLNKTQLATTNFDLNNYVSAFSEEFYKSITKQRRRKRGFLFFKSKSSSLSKFITQTSNSGITSTSSINNSIFLRDVESDLILRSLEGYVYKPFIENVSRSSALMDEVIRNHEQARVAAVARGDNNLANAHEKYIQYLESLKNRRDNQNLENNALESLLSALNNGEGSGEAAAGTVAAKSNPYLAAAIFLSKGLVFENESNSGTFSYTSLRRHVFTQQENKSFNAQLSTQVNNSHVIAKSYFPEIELYDEYLNEDEVIGVKYDDSQSRYQPTNSDADKITAKTFEEFIEVNLARGNKE
ncbi:hypothetical protein [Flagellimonas sp.]|uniref:hypothetical protein n=1 Tax=Flagellimonas sp. TaxID=2058762 RepID=UPI003B528E10